jgi:hypothetical protein
MKEICEEIIISSSIVRVWRILLDFSSYPDWNPFIRRIKGKIEAGSKLDVRIQPSGSKGLSMRPTVLKPRANYELRWIGHLFLPGLFDGEHSFTLNSSEPDQVRFIQREIFKGLLVSFFPRDLEQGTRRGFQEMNLALKVRAENPV